MHEPRARLRGFLIWLGVVVALGLLSFTRFWLEALATGQAENARVPLVNEMTAMLGAGILFFPLRALVRRWPLGRGAWLRRLPLYALALIALSVAHTSLNWGMRAALYPALGLGSYHYGVMPVRYAMELPYDTIAFVVAAAALHGIAGLRAAREQALRAARLEGSLARAELRSLRLSLQPHFLFNALHTISSTMYEDPAAADEMLDALAELLRASLRTAQADEATLGEELVTLDRYLSLMRARFGERLAVTVDVSPALHDVLVPSLLLQPLVENAVRHGNAERTGRGVIAVRANAPGDELVVVVEDDGPGCPPGRDPLAAGLGLRATAERLQLLHGERARLAATNGDRRGFVVRIELPLRRDVAARAATLGADDVASPRPLAQARR